MHKLLTGYPKTDHRDGDGLNNQRYNLRETTDAQNGANTGPRTGRYKGVHRYEGQGLWRAQIQVNGIKNHIGVYSSEESAARAYDQAALAIWGEFARLNFPYDGSILPLRYGDVG
jgi:AP2 domain